ncbi:hypothetical protein [Sulfitobacter guttiformis]|uniref:Uncharacterized protein n=1 Tax=Sulfitobacter guttiformis TaxID=74349 RepID=A0A420DN60_9RHOB|nr:hypothetical protein [Sulfitobacter guttiformis]KIN72995.1 hypothetical protein Z949_2177 [Sulfitobacter guttiformis KCTC 32187]RKE95682.1 hypothetical protein C8N30_0219 [Sulfitobacter guttiformis]
MFLEALNFIAIPLVIAVIECAIFAVVLGKAGLPRWTAVFPFVPVACLVGIYLAGGWIAFYEVLGPIPLVIPIYQLLMVLIGFIPLFILATVRWPSVLSR